MSHGEILKMPPSEVPQHRNLQPQVPNGAGVRSPAASSSSLPPHSPVSSNSSSTSVNEYKVARYWDQWRRINGEGLLALVLNIIRIMETFFLNQWSLWTGPPILGVDNMLKHTLIIVSYHQNVISDKPDFFKASVVVRSQSSSSNTSRWGTGGSRNASGSDWEKGDKQVLWLRERMSGDLQNIDTVDTEQNKNAGQIH